jgi:polyisoprenoid-binding protein YceI
VGFAVKHMVVSTYRGQFDDYDATLTAKADGTLRLEGSVKPASVVVKDENLAGHLASPDFFDVANYPEIRFSSTLVRIGGGELIVDGELTIKGHTRPIEARGAITEPVVALGNDVQLIAELQFAED